MSHLKDVLTRSLAHLDPSDRVGRERMLASAREKMVRLLSSYDPPLTAVEIETKIDEFDATTRAIMADFDGAPPRPRPIRWTEPPSAIGRPTPPAAPAKPAAPPPPPPPPPPPEPELEPIEPAADEEDEEPFYEDEAEDYAEGDAYRPEDDYEIDEFYEDDDLDPEEDEEDEPPRRSWLKLAAIVIGILILLAALVGGGLYAYQRLQAGSAPVAVETPPSPEPDATVATASPAEPADAPPAEATTTPASQNVVQAVPATPSTTGAPSPGTTTPEAPAAAATVPVAELPAPSGPPALETLVLFDGRDPTAFQSAPDNPVRFQGDTDGGFAEIASSTGSTGARLLVGPGVFERIAGRTFRWVVSARGSRETPATMVRFAYQNGRNLSPWSDMRLEPRYAPLAMTWSVPKERGGPDRDALIIEPGIPGDDTAADIRAVRIEVLS